MSALHPLSVHFPIALAILWPVIDAIGLKLGRADISNTAVVLLVIGLGASLLSTMSGQAAYDDAIRAGHTPEVLGIHADVASLVPWLLLGVTAIRTAGVHKAGKRAHVVAIIAGLVVAGVVGLVGLTGGQLVYQHGVGIQRKSS